MEGIQIRREKLTDFILPFKDLVAVDKFTIDNGFMSVELINYGATITAIYLPNKTGYEDDIVLGFEDPLDYLRRRNPYLGATIGRYGNLISGARFSISGEVFYTSMNSPPDTYHGGIQGLDKKIWDARIEDNALVMTYKSYDLDQGFPGDVCIKAKFILTLENQLIIIYSATSNKRTPINILNECYFNLAGHATGRPQILEHELKINSNYYVVTTEDGRPTGEVDEVESTFYDLKELISVKDVIESEDEFNMEVAFCFGGEGMKNVAFLRHAESGRSLTVYSDQPCLTLKLGQDFKKMPGKEEAVYRQHSGVCFQTGNLPDAIRHECFPNPILNPGEEYKHTIVWKFRVEGLTDMDEVVEKPAAEEEEKAAEERGRRAPRRSTSKTPPEQSEPEKSSSEVKKAEDEPQKEPSDKKLESPEPIETAEQAQINIEHKSTTENTKTTVEKQ